MKRGTIAAILSVAAALGAGYLAGTRRHVPSGEVAAAATTYFCPMHPTYTSDRPGECPICHMSLVPQEKEPQGGAHAGHGAVGAAPAGGTAPGSGH